MSMNIGMGMDSRTGRAKDGGEDRYTDTYLGNFEPISDVDVNMNRNMNRQHWNWVWVD